MCRLLLVGDEEFIVDVMVDQFDVIELVEITIDIVFSECDVIEAVVDNRVRHDLRFRDRVAQFRDQATAFRFGEGMTTTGTAAYITGTHLTSERFRIHVVECSSNMSNRVRGNIGQPCNHVRCGVIRGRTGYNGCFGFFVSHNLI